MVEEIDDLPSGVVGLRATGDFLVEDFDTVVTPRVDQLVASDDPVRLLLHLSEEFTGFGEGAWGDLTDGILRLPFHRAAIVTDEDKIAMAINLMKWMLRGDVRTFRNHEYHNAATWVAT